MHSIRSVRLLTLGAALLLGGATVADAQPTRPPAPGRPRTGDVGRAPRAGRPVGERREQLGGALFRGIDLTTAQRRQLRDIGLRYGDQREDLALSLRNRAGITPGQRPDSATRARFRTELETQHRALMDRQIADLRNVLTAEQRTAFDRNVAQFRERAQTRASAVRDGAGARRDRALRGRALREGARREGALRRGALRQDALRERAFRGARAGLAPRALAGRGVREQALRARMLRARAVRERAFRGRDLDRRPLPGRAFRDRDFRREE